MLRAADDFKNRVAAVRAFLQVDQSLDNPPGITPADKIPLVFFLRTGVAVLSVSLFEDFLRTLMEAFIDEINAKAPRIAWADLPQKLRQSHVFDTPMTLSKRQPPNESYETYENNYLSDLRVTFTNILSPLVSPDAYVITAEAFTDTNDNPISSTVTSLFNRIGIPDVFSNPDFLHSWQTVDSRYSSRESVVRELDSIVILRHSFAHGRRMDPAAGLTVTRGDLETNLTFLERLSKNLEALAILFLNHLGTDTSKFSGKLTLSWIMSDSIFASTSLSSGRDVGANILVASDAKQLLTLLGDDEAKIDAMNHANPLVVLNLVDCSTAHLSRFKLMKKISERNLEIAGKNWINTEFHRLVVAGGKDITLEPIWSDSPEQTRLSFRIKGKRTQSITISLRDLLSVSRDAATQATVRTQLTDKL